MRLNFTHEMFTLLAQLQLGTACKPSAGAAPAADAAAPAEQVDAGEAAAAPAADAKADAAAPAKKVHSSCDNRPCMQTTTNFCVSGLYTKLRAAAVLSAHVSRRPRLTYRVNSPVNYSYLCMSQKPAVGKKKALPGLKVSGGGIEKPSVGSAKKPAVKKEKAEKKEKEPKAEKAPRAKSAYQFFSAEQRGT